MRKKGEKDNRNGLSAQGEIGRGKTREVPYTKKLKRVGR